MNLLNVKTEKISEMKEKKFSDLSCWGKFEYICELPDDWIRRLTILPCSPNRYDKYYTIVWPYFGILTTEMIVMREFPVHWGFWYYLPFAVGWSILFYYIQGTIDPEAE